MTGYAFRRYDQLETFPESPRRSSKNCDLQFANGDRLKANYSVDKGNSVDAIFLDFQKAIDKVPKTRLLQKHSANGIEGKVLCLIAYFLSNRKLQIMVRGEYSERVDVISGVYSSLGTILCKIYS